MYSDFYEATRRTQFKSYLVAAYAVFFGLLRFFAPFPQMLSEAGMGFSTLVSLLLNYIVEGTYRNIITLTLSQNALPTIPDYPILKHQRNILLGTSLEWPQCQLVHSQALSVMVQLSHLYHTPSNTPQHNTSLSTEQVENEPF